MSTYRTATSEDIAALAKTGCASCHGAGRYKKGSGQGARFDLCRCVAKHKNAGRLAVTEDKQVVIETDEAPA